LKEKMKNKSFGLIMAAGICAAGLITNASAVSTTTFFGTIPNLPSGPPTPQPYSGNGIPVNTSEITTINGLAGGDSITLAEAATQHGSGNPAPGNDGAGTYTVGTGQNGSPLRSLWNFDFFINVANGDFSSYTFSLVETGNGHTASFDPTSILLGDTLTGTTGLGNSESLDFAFAGVPLAYDPNANDTYGFTLEAFQGGTEIGSDSITVVAGTGGAVPDRSSTAGLLMASLGAMAIVGKRKNILSALGVL
jgi:hypothetical protein